ncbi:hypothetical protein KDA_10450 [Dictyobacter alpinus]|uniref:GH26 domain-containing protein n=1 Tax=Dictyobacter alpinus TaxID=2014873 RepID=A0A402B2I5_9CHLR|nr:glycosyltransferase [Dictyobacter alpinus]GCE25561.1 hypothetical protein KDA_10450 [Dictyobacter alpinus]
MLKKIPSFSGKSQDEKPGSIQQDRYADSQDPLSTPQIDFTSNAVGDHFGATINSSANTPSAKIDVDENTHKIPAVKSSNIDTSPVENEITSPAIPAAKRSSETTISKAGVYDLSVVTPTRDERDNVLPLLQILKSALAGIRVEVIFVDDSDDNTPEVVKQATQTLGSPDFHVHIEHRVKGPERKGGLATAVDLGLHVAQARYVAVIDADLQHPPAQLRVFYDEAVKQDVDLVLASRYIKGGSPGGLAGPSRLFFSVGLKWVAKILFPSQLAGVSDPLGGFFLLKRSLLNDVTLRPIGYKILLEILVRCQWQSLAEVPYHFQQREHGESKADFQQGVWALQHMGRLFKEVPAAGRVWKLGALILLNVIALLAMYFVYPYATSFWNPLSIFIFVFLALINLGLLNRFVFPPRREKDELHEFNSLVSVDQELTSVIPAVRPNMVKTTSATQVDSIAQRQTVRTTSVPSGLGRTVTRKSTRTNKLGSLLVPLLVLIALGWIGYMALGLTSYALPNAWVIIAALFFGLSISLTASYKKTNFHQIITMLLAIAVGISFMDYVSWRFEVTNWAGWWIAVPLLFAETLGAVHTVGLQFTLWPRQQLSLKRTEDPTQYPVFVFIPTVNEGVAVLKPTLDGILGARKSYLEKYPHGEVNIVLCNDGYVAKAPDWQATEELARQMGVICITRRQPGGAKAGNIENARQQLGATGNALMIIFDADQVAKEDFLLKTIPPFADPRVGWVQTGQYYRNLDNPVTRWADDQQAMFYNLLCPGKATWNAAFICGTNVVLRTQALDEIGGLPQDSVTEDFAASISLHTRWKSIYLTDVLATGLGPMDMPAYLKQQRRWAIGTLGVMREHWRDILLPKKGGLSLGQRIQYFLACTHYLCGIRDLIYLICPLLFIFTSIPAVRGSTLDAFIWHFVPYFLSSAAVLWYAGRGITGLRGIIIGFGCFPVLIESLVAVILKRKVGFTVTSKKRGSKNSNSYIWIYLTFLVASIAAIAYSLYANVQQRVSMLISVLWVIYAIAMLSSFLWLCYCDWRAQKSEQKSANAPLQEGSFDYPARTPQRMQGMRAAWNSALALALAGLIFASTFFHATGAAATPFTTRLAPGQAPYIGVSLPVTLVKQRPALVKQKLGTDLGIVGRTQEINDQFDRPWADQLAAQHSSPWITLQFGAFQPNGLPATNSSLLSIANGLHDDALKRWAQQVRSYNKPVYITILLHVDRNWSLSSAVANGGIPQDAPRAWKHVQSVFEQQGATNVSWVWSPADPAHDQAYAPPASTIDAVLLSMISYPKTKWTDPQKAVNAVVQRYPDKPVILEVSAAGNAAQKAAWLQKVGKTVEQTHDIYALIYHDASPALKSTVKENDQWSMFSDPASTHVMQQIATTLKR